MKAEIIISKIGEILETYKFEEANEASKIEVLNIANAVLYPIKEKQIIEDYQFLARVEDNSIHLTIMLKEPNEEEASEWDIVLH
jgi:hypothetical protein